MMESSQDVVKTLEHLWYITRGFKLLKRLNVKFIENHMNIPADEKQIYWKKNFRTQENVNLLEIEENTENQNLSKEQKYVKSHLTGQILGDVGKEVQTPSRLGNTENMNATISKIQTKSANKALKDENWTAAMIEELN